MSREGGMRVVQTAPRGYFWRVDGGVVASNRPVAGGPAESPIFSPRLWHACKSTFKRPEVPSGALEERKLGVSRPRPSGPCGTTLGIRHLDLCTSAIVFLGLRALECTLACMPESGEKMGDSPWYVCATTTVVQRVERGGFGRNDDKTEFSLVSGAAASF